MTDAHLGCADLSWANLSGADLSAANLSLANLGGANLTNALLISVIMTNANLAGAQMQGSRLAGAYLGGADLNRANLSEADLSMVNLAEASLAGVIYELKPGTLPDIPACALAKNLSEMTYTNSPHALVELKAAFAKAGLREREHEVNYAIMRTRRTSSGFFEKALLLAVEIPCAYGMTPGRPLKILFCLILVFWIPYVIALKKHGKNGIWIIWPRERVPKDESTEENARLNPQGFFHKLVIAFYFSILSAFNIGWKEINIGTWIARIQPKEFTLSATGWVRVVAGIQSLISVYLVALWFLSYFGHLFE